MGEGTLYALFRDGKQISKAHTSRLAVATEAFERGLMLTASPDFPDHLGRDQMAAASLADGCEIRQVAPSHD